MPNVEIYTWTYCPYCVQAKRLLDAKGIQYAEHCIDGDDAARQKMTQRAGGKRTLPQIFIDDRHVGGCTDLYDLDRRGLLDPLLKAG